MEKICMIFVAWHKEYVLKYEFKYVRERRVAQQYQHSWDVTIATYRNVLSSLLYLTVLLLARIFM